MKHLLIVCIALLCTSMSWAEQVDIKFMKGERGEDYRSISFEPTATHDGNTISIYSYIPLDNVQICVKDIMGNIVYTNTVIIPARQTFSFTLDNVESGNYILEVTYPNKYLYGNFIL